jgi:Family of unknown function (DUF5675)
MGDKEFWLLIERYFYTARTTIGKLFFVYHLSPGNTKEFFCFTLEDTARPSNIKVFGETCLPGGLECNVAPFENDHFKKTIIFYTQSDKQTILVPPLQWVGCLGHNGVSHKDTEGCILLGQSVTAATIDFPEPTLSGGMKEALRTRLDKAWADGYTIKAQFVNLTQLS